MKIKQFTQRFDEDSLENMKRAQRISFEGDVLPQLAGTGKLFAFRAERFWLSIKSAGSALFANRAILDSYNKKHPELLTEQNNCRGNVYIHPSAEVDPTAVVSDLTIVVYCLIANDFVFFWLKKYM